MIKTHEVREIVGGPNIIKVSLVENERGMYLDFRKFFTTDDGEVRPTKQGVWIPVRSIEGIRDALKDLERLALELEKSE